MNCFIRILAVLFAISIVETTCSQSPDETKAELIQRLEKEMKSQAGFIKVHAAEALIAVGQQVLVQDCVQADLESAKLPVAIGYRRVLAQTESEPSRREIHLKAIRDVSHDSTSDFRVHAIESLCKLNDYRAEDRSMIQAFIASNDDAKSAFALWYLALSGEAVDIERLIGLMKSEDAMARMRTYYAISRMPRVSERLRDQLVAQVKVEPKESPAWIFLLSAIAVVAPKDISSEQIQALATALRQGQPHDALEASRGLAKLSNAKIEVFLAALDAQHPDNRIAAASGALSVLVGTVGKR